ncbi:hypothetical protein MMC32_005421 [Xylographa parallela]|nr:hypothetical protein [Xylographa parallela]
MTDFPICGVLGQYYTNFLGFDYASAPDNSDACMADCIANGTCKAVAFGTPERFCFFLSDYLYNDEFEQSHSSKFYYWDNVCLNSNSSTTASAIRSTTISTAYPTTTTNSPQYVSGYPMCGVSGYVPQTADAALILGTVSGFSQPHCIDSCRDNPSCRAISFESELKKCTLYSKAIQFLDVTSTTESSLKFYDEVCGEKIASTSTFTVTVTTTPPTATSESPTVSSYVTAFPVCGTPGFTAEPGDHYNDVYPPAPVSKNECVKACRRNATCKAVSYAAEYKLCSFYRLYMMEDQLEEDETSNFAHFDDFCSL